MELNEIPVYGAGSIIKADHINAIVDNTKYVAETLEDNSDAINNAITMGDNIATIQNQLNAIDASLTEIENIINGQEGGGGTITTIRLDVVNVGFGSLDNEDYDTKTLFNDYDEYQIDELSDELFSALKVSMHTSYKFKAGINFYQYPQIYFNGNSHGIKDVYLWVKVGGISYYHKMKKTEITPFNLIFGVNDSYEEFSNKYYNEQKQWAETHQNDLTFGLVLTFTDDAYGDSVFNQDLNNVQIVMDSNEGGTPSLEERLSALEEKLG